MPVLKSQQASEACKDAIVMDLRDVRAEAARMIADARAEARQIVVSAQQQRQRISDEAHDEAYQRGHTEGVQQGMEDGRRQGRAEAHEQASQQLNELQQAWIEAAQSWEAQRQEMDRQARQAVLDFAVLFARKLVHRVIEVDDRVIIDQVAAALSHVLRPLDVTIRINRDDRPTLEQALPDLLEQVNGLEHLRLIDDETVGPGGCVVNYAQGQIDATVDTQVRRIVELTVPQRTPAAPSGETS